MRLKSWSISPPGGWSYHQDETGLILKGKDDIELVQQVMDHREYKGLDRLTESEVRDDIEEQTISRIDSNEHYCTRKQVVHGGSSS